MSSTALLRGLIPTWVSGNSYLLGEQVWSSVSGHIYRRIVAGAGATDPSSDGTNWKLVGPGGVKSIQRGVISFGAVTSATATLSPAVNPSNTEVRLLGSINGTAAADPQWYRWYLSLTNSTTLTATRAATGGTGSISWEVTEFWA